MIDTIRASVWWPRRNNFSNDWIRSTKSTEVEVAWEDEPQPVETSHSVWHKTLGIRAYSSGRRFTSVEFSLPRLIHGDNGQLIRSQEEIDSAIANMRNAMETVANTGSGIRDIRRVDLALHFLCDPAAVIAAHHNCRYPRTSRKTKRDFSPSSASWDYTGRRFAFYDKGRERAAGFGGAETTSEILRVEVQLRGGPLKRLLGSSGGLAFPIELDFQKCYDVFRSELIKFAPSRDIACAGSKEQALAMLDRYCSRIGGLLPSEIFTQHMSAPTKRRWRRKIAAAHTNLVSFSWEALLPEGGPPPIHDA